ncbi:MAG: hypothetical protein ACR2RE_02715 [Geminicoccaceae bacterium]
MTETATTEQTETPPEKDEQLAERHGFIDFDKIEDPEVRKEFEERFKGLYRSQKDTATAYSEMQRMYASMEKKVSELEAVKQKEASDTKLAGIKKGIADANAKGDYEKAVELQEELVEAKATKPVEKPKNDDVLSPQQTDMLMNWQAELTDDGRLARPWASRTHRAYKDTISQLVEVGKDPQFSSKGFSAVLAEVDRRMAPKPKQTSPVADGDATPSRPSGKTAPLTEQQKRVARRMFGDRDDPIKAYIEAQKKWT